MYAVGSGWFVQEAQTAVADVPLPAGVHLTWGGQFENLQRAEARLMMVVPVEPLIGSLLYMALGTIREAALVPCHVPRLCGWRIGTAAAWYAVSCTAAVGFIAVAVATLNGLVPMQAIRERSTAGDPLLRSLPLARRAAFAPC